MPHDGVAKVVQPVVIVGVAGQRVLGPVVVRVDLVPQEGHHVKRSMHPVHAEGHEVVVRHKAQGALLKRCHHLGLWRIVAWNGVVEAHVESKLAEQSQAVVEQDCLQLLHVPATEVFLLLERMLFGRLGAKAREGEEHSLQVGVVEPRHGGLGAKERGQLLQSPGALDVHLLPRKQVGSSRQRSQTASDSTSTRRSYPNAAR